MERLISATYFLLKKLVTYAKFEQPLSATTYNAGESIGSYTGMDMETMDTQYTQCKTHKILTGRKRAISTNSMCFNGFITSKTLLIRGAYPPILDSPAPPGHARMYMGSA